jgi:catechol 2,3-dioxygenase-like lactoylglutathione lyase family enzyme
MIKSVTHVTLFVNDQDEALNFYTNKLGFQVHTDAQFEGMRWLTLNPKGQKDFEVVLFQVGSDEEKSLVGKQGSQGVFLCLASDNIDNDFQELKAKGVEFLGSPEAQPWGKAVLCKDLYGNGLYIVESLQ